MDHYTDYGSFSTALIGFSQHARKAGFSAGLQCSQDAVQAALLGLWLDRDLFGHALASLFCQSAEERERFRPVYDRFWRMRGTRINDKRDYKNTKKIVKAPKSIAVMAGIGKENDQDQGEDSKNSSGAHAKETIKKTDFSKLSATETALLDEISEKLVREMSLRIRRKRKKSHKGQVNLGQSIRQNLQNGGTIIDLVKSKKKREKYRLLILLDVSGSMDKYSFYLLKFLWSLRIHFKQIEAFAFSTKLMRITDYISDKDLATTLLRVSHHVTHWSSGTKIGDCLKDFNENYAKRHLNGNTVTLVLSDGLDTGEPEVLSAAIQKIKLRSKKLVWLNPLKGMEGYEPIQEGMKTALPALDHFGAAHNFASLLELENILVHA
ncbi:MAG: VWA domain-containing protein [Bacteroidota bacterium]